MNKANYNWLTSLVLLTAAISASAGWFIRSVRAENLPLETAPETVILDELEDAYEPVPFDHLSHAKMAEMWNGCVTCHHRTPQVVEQSDESTTLTLLLAKTQEDAGEIPACKSCHAVLADEGDIRMPSLKGAYHRQCLNCHQEWMHENACVICHEPKDNGHTVQGAPSPGDIMGRMHPPIPEPDDKHYDTRFTPADGGNVLFRHREHTVDFGIKCVNCHRKDNCSHCHGGSEDTSAQKPLRPGMTWEASHEPCMACHQKDRCRHCHYKDGQPPPSAFDHRRTGQELDEEHLSLACALCHEDLQFEPTPTCGSTECHPDSRIEYPDQLPGLVVPVESPVMDETAGEGQP